MIFIKYSAIKRILIEKKIFLRAIASNYNDFRKIYNNTNELIERNSRLKDDQICAFPDRFIIEPYSSFFNGNAFCSIGSFSFSNSPVTNFMKVGRYCSIAKGLNFFGFNHPLEFVTTSSVTFDKAFSCGQACLLDNNIQEHILYNYNSFYYRDGNVNIGNDVWIGSNVSIKRGVKICDGSVIAANACVCNDVPPYAIVGGVPAKIIRYRFSEDIIKGLIESKWWSYDINQLQNLSLDNPYLFIQEVKILKDKFSKDKTYRLEPLTQDDINKVLSK